MPLAKDIEVDEKFLKEKQSFTLEISTWRISRPIKVIRWIYYFTET